MKRIEQPESVKGMSGEAKKKFLAKLSEAMRRAERAVTLMRAMEAMVSGRVISDGEYALFKLALGDREV